jgi:hypothetical protein
MQLRVTSSRGRKLRGGNPSHVKNAIKGTNMNITNQVADKEARESKNLSNPSCHGMIAKSDKTTTTAADAMTGRTTGCGITRIVGLSGSV